MNKLNERQHRGINRKCCRACREGGGQQTKAGNATQQGRKETLKGGGSRRKPEQRFGGGEAKSWETASFTLSVKSPSREGGSRAWHRGLCCPYVERQLRLLGLLEITPISWRNQCDKEHAKRQKMRRGQSKSQRGNRKEKNIKKKKKAISFMFCLNFIAIVISFWGLSLLNL